MFSITADDGVRLDVHEHGRAADPPVVLIAGFRAPASSWRYQVPALVEAGHRVVAVDLRGHGETHPLELGVTMQRRAHDLDIVLAQLDLHDVAIIGGSMGASTIWAYVQQFGTARLRAVVSVDQTPKMLTDDAWRHGFYGYDESVRDTHFRHGIPRTGHGTPLWRRGMRLVRLLRAMDAKPGALSAAELELLHDHAVADWLPTIRTADVPALFVAGAESELWPSSHAAAAAAIAPQGSSAVIVDDGHAANIEQPDAFNAGVLEFLAR